MEKVLCRRNSIRIKKNCSPPPKKKHSPGVEPGTTRLKAQHLNPLGHTLVLPLKYKLLYISLIHDKFIKKNKKCH